jgi:phosphopantothenoylcysteine decarboxylase/phosphopantothenate--cysteine ligase
MVANDVGAPGIGFGSDDNEVTVLFADGAHVLIPRAPKRVIADRLWTLLAPRVAAAKPAVGRAAPTVVPKVRRA